MKYPVYIAFTIGQVVAEVGPLRNNETFPDATKARVVLKNTKNLQKFLPKH